MQVLYELIKQIIIILSFCSLLLLFNGCGTVSQTEENDVSDFEFTNISDIKYSSELEKEKPQIHSKEKLEALKEKQKQQIAQVEKQLTLLKEEDEQQTEEEEEENFEEPVYNYESEYVEDYNYVDTDYNYSADYDIYYAEYNEMYNTDGPTPTMPGWYDGYLETSYNASAHYLADTWTVDDEGFYKDENDRYVIGVEMSEINPNTGEPYQYGDVVQTGKGEAVVYDRGQGAHVHDFAVIW